MILLMMQSVIVMLVMDGNYASDNDNDDDDHDDHDDHDNGDDDDDNDNNDNNDVMIEYSFLSYYQ